MCGIAGWIAKPQGMLSADTLASMLQAIYIPNLGVRTSTHVPMGYLLFTIAVSLAVAIIGYALFNRMKWSFVERP